SRPAPAGRFSPVDRRAVLMRRFLRIVLRLVAGALLVALAMLLALRTAPGKRALLRVALPLINRNMAGHLSVRGINGDLWNRIVLLDARLDDAEGVEAIYARRVEARVDLRAFWDRRLHIRDEIGRASGRARGYAAVAAPAR